MAIIPMGTNVLVEVKGDKLIITVDLTKENGMSASGKSRMIATTGAPVAVPGTDVKVGLNVFRPIR